MSEESNGRRVFSLFEVMRSIQKVISSRYGSAYWIKAEMNKLNHYHRSGHCYPDLVEKQGGKVVAEIRANLWRDDYQRINARFLQVLQEPLKDGIKILIQAKVSFHPVHGLSLSILDIDPDFTLGDLAREKRETIQKLQLEGVYGRNKTLSLPLLPQRIAVISVETSKGYADFQQVFESAQATWNYRFFQMLFPSLLQGNGAVATMLGQLRRIKKVLHHFDVVAIVRGGGGDIGLSCYNDYELAREIALFPIPVITGIGHSTNETVSEMVAHENAITPTKLAEFLIQHFHNYSVPVQRAEEAIADKSQRLIREERSRLGAEIKLLHSITQNALIKSRTRFDRNVQALSQQSRFRLQGERMQLAGLSASLERSTGQACLAEKQAIQQLAAQVGKASESHLKTTRLILEAVDKNLTNLHPDNTLKRGFSITRLGGKAVHSTDQLQEGDVLETELSEGTVSSKVESTSKTPEA